jgi:membrane protease subunit HflC
MTRSYTVFLIILAVVLALLGINLFTVYESERAIITQLGEMKKDTSGKIKVYGPGLHWKMPLLDTVNIFDSRLDMIEVPSERIVTKEKEVLLIDLFVQWKISDYALFYNSTYGTVEGMNGRDRAEQLLRQTVKGVLHAEFGQRTLQYVVSGERKELMEKIRKRVNENINGFGMQIVDVRVNRVDYPPEVNDKVFARMSSERKGVAVAYRASGESKAAIIRAEADKTARVVLAEATKEAQRLKGEGDGKAAQIYADSFNQSPEFYRFMRSLEAYKRVFQDKQDILVLKPEGDFFKYFRNNGQNGQKGVKE